MIELHSNCNRSCWFCPRTYDRSGKYRNAAGGNIDKAMPGDMVTDLLDQAQALGFTGRVAFHHFSEPLLDDRNLVFAAEAAKRGMQPYLVTNGDLLRGNSALCRQVQQAYDRIVVGIYDYTTEEELKQVRQFWADLLPRVNLEFSPIGLNGKQSAYSVGIPRALVPSDARMAVPDLSYENAPCQRPLIRMIVQYDGEICNCCDDTRGAFDLGNVYQASLAEIWNSERHIQLTKELAGGRRGKYEFCANCPQSPTGPALPGQKIGISFRRYKTPSKS